MLLLTALAVYEETVVMSVCRIEAVVPDAVLTAELEEPS